MARMTIISMILNGYCLNKCPHITIGYLAVLQRAQIIFILYFYFIFELNREIPKYVLLSVVHSIQGLVFFCVLMKRKK